MARLTPLHCSRDDDVAGLAHCVRVAAAFSVLMGHYNDWQVCCAVVLHDPSRMECAAAGTDGLGTSLVQVPVVNALPCVGVFCVSSCLIHQSHRTFIVSKGTLMAHRHLSEACPTAMRDICSERAILAMYAASCGLI